MPPSSFYAAASLAGKKVDKDRNKSETLNYFVENKRDELLSKTSSCIPSYVIFMCARRIGRIKREG